MALPGLSLDEGIDEGDETAQEEEDMGQPVAVYPASREGGKAKEEAATWDGPGQEVAHSLFPVFALRDPLLTETMRLPGCAAAGGYCDPIRRQRGSRGRERGCLSGGGGPE